MEMRSFFGRPDRRHWSSIFGSAVCLALVAGWLATNASLSAAAGQYNPGIFVKSTAQLSKDGTQVTITGTASCSPATSGDFGVWVSQDAYSASGGTPGSCGPTKTSFSVIANVGVSPPTGPLSKGPALVSAYFFASGGGRALLFSPNVPVNLK